MKHLQEHSRLAAAAVAAATLTAAVGRILSPGNGTIWRDEGVTLFIIRIPTLGGMLEYHRLHETHPPLFSLLMRLWQALIGRSEGALALVPLVCAVAIVPFAYLVAAKAHSRTAGLIAAWIVAVHPTLLFYSPQIRYYSVFSLLAVLSTYALWSLTNAARSRTWVLYVTSSLAMLLVHNWGWLILGSQAVLSTLLVIFRQTRPAARDAQSIVAAWAAIAAGYLPWLPALLHQTRNANPPPGTGGILEAFAFVTSVTVGPSSWVALVFPVALIVAVLLHRRTVSTWVEGAREMRALILFGMVPVVIALSGGLLRSRAELLLTHTISTLVPFVALLLAFGIATLIRNGHRVVAGAAGMIVVGLLAGNASRYLASVKSNAAAVADAVAAKVRSDDVVIIAPEWLASSFNYYFNAPNRQIVYPHLSRVELPEWDNIHARFADTTRLAAVKDSISALRDRRQRVWLVEERSWAAREVPDVLVLPESLYGRYGSADLIRAAQVRRHLISLYGPPDTLTVPPDRRRGREMLRASLFKVQ